MSVLHVGRLRSRRYVRKVLKQQVMGWEYNRHTLNTLNNCFHRKVAFYNQPYHYQAICGMWAYIPILCVQRKDRGLGKTYE